MEEPKLFFTNAIFGTNDTQIIVPDELPSTESDEDVLAYVAAARLARMQRLRRSGPHHAPQPLDKLTTRMRSHSLKRPQHRRENTRTPRASCSHNTTQGEMSLSGNEHFAESMEVDKAPQEAHAPLTPIMPEGDVGAGQKQASSHIPELRSLLGTSQPDEASARNSPRDMSPSLHPEDNECPEPVLEVDEGYCEGTDDYAWLVDDGKLAFSSSGAHRANGLLRFRSSSAAEVASRCSNVVRSIPRMRKRKQKKREVRSRASTLTTGYDDAGALRSLTTASSESWPQAAAIRQDEILVD